MIAHRREWYLAQATALEAEAKGWTDWRARIGATAAERADADEQARKRYDKAAEYRRKAAGLVPARLTDNASTRAESGGPGGGEGQSPRRDRT